MISIENQTVATKIHYTVNRTLFVNEDGIIEKIFTPKEIKTKIHAEQILDFIKQ